jgi:hypothetical protein
MTIADKRYAVTLSRCIKQTCVLHVASDSTRNAITAAKNSAKNCTDVPWEDQEDSERLRWEDCEQTKDTVVHES